MRRRNFYVLQTLWTTDRRQRGRLPELRRAAEQRLACIPIVGLVLFLVWKDTKPRNAKAAGIGALVSVILSVLYYVFIFTASISFGLLA